jgi:hypothetical protein
MDEERRGGGALKEDTKVYGDREGREEAGRTEGK